MKRGWAAAAIGALTAAIIAASALGAGIKTTRVSVSSSGAEGNDFSYAAAISADGRYVVFASSADNLVKNDNNGTTDVFVRDLKTGKTKAASVNGAGHVGNGASAWPSISADGRKVAFYSDASDLVHGDTNSTEDVFVHDMKTGKTKRASVSSSGVQGNASSRYNDLSGSGRFVTFESDAGNLVHGDHAGKTDIFLHDMKTGKTRRVDVGPKGQEANNTSYSPAISADGKRIVYSSLASNIVKGDANGESDEFVWSAKTKRNTLASLNSAGKQANDFSGSFPSISANGRFVAFSSGSTNLVSHDNNGVGDVFLHDMKSGRTKLVSLSSSGEQADGSSFLVDPLAVSNDGRYVSFISLATNLHAGVFPGENDYLRDLKKGKTRYLNVSSSGTLGNGNSYDPGMTPDASKIIFISQASNLVNGDTNGASDIFLQTKR